MNININNEHNSSKCAATVTGTISETTAQPDIIGYFPLYGKTRPDTAPAERISDTPPDGECADVFSDDIAVVQFNKDSSTEKIIHILDECGTHYRAVETEFKIRLFFCNNGLKENYHGTILCGVNAITAGSNGYLDHLDGNLAVIHADSDYDELPLWLCPIKDSSPLYSPTLLTGEIKWINYMKQVYNWIITSRKYSRDEAYAATIETAKVLNRHFRKHPFNEKRMLSALDIAELEFNIKYFHTEETDPSGRIKSVFQKDQFAEWFVERYHLINLDHNAHRYSNGVYVPISEKECETMIFRYLENSTSTQRKELVQTVFSLLGIYASETTSEADMYYDLHSRCKPEMIAFNNGIFDIITGEWHDFDPDIIITNRIPVDYVDYKQKIEDEEQTESMQTINNWLDSFCEGNSNKRAVLEESAGLALYCRNMGLRRQHTILVGIKESGKSTYIKMVEDLIGKENCSHIALEDICNPNDRFCTYSLVGKTLNSFADISSDPIKSTARLKNICTGDAIRVEQKNQPASTLVWNGKMLFGCNCFPGISDEALIDRFEIIPCNASFNGTGSPDLYEKHLKKPECMQYWCYLAVQGLQRFIKNNYRHTYCKEIEQFRRRFTSSVNPVAAFVNATPEEGIDGHETGEVFSKYTDYCIHELELPEPEVNHFTKNKLTSALKGFGYDTIRKSVNNDKIQIYAKCS